MTCTNRPLSPSKETILLADDCNIVRECITAILSQYGYDIVEAVDGEDALSQFKKNRDRIQLLLMDIMMNKMSGIEAYNAIAKENPDIKVIFMSGHSFSTLNQKGYLHSDAEFISKPFATQSLIQKIRKALLYVSI